MQFEALQRLKSVEVPNDDVSLNSQGKIQITRFDSTTAAILGVDNLLRNLGGFSGQMRCYYRNVVVVTAQEVLSSCDDVAQHDGRTQRVENVFVVWVQNEALRYPA